MTRQVETATASGTNRGEEFPLGMVADFVSSLASDAIPQEAVAAAVRGIIDLVGVTVAGAAQHEMKSLLTYVDRTYGPGPSTAFGLFAPKVPEGAAWINSAAGHVLDFDDCIDGFEGHPSVVTLPAVLALTEALHVPAAKAIDAYVVGVEVSSAIGRCLNPVHYERGWHPTATLGLFGATSAAARLLGLDRETILRALAIAASFSSGIKANFGSFTKPVQVGFAASKGIAAARLAELGVSASGDVFQGPLSFPAAFNGVDTHAVDWSPIANLGRDWSIVSPGLIFKLYPCCESVHSPIEAIRELMIRENIDSKRIDRIDVYIDPRRLPHTDRPHPQSGFEGKFSIQYAVALAATRATVGIDDFSDDRLNDEEVRAMLGRIQAHELPLERRTVVAGRLDCVAADVCVRDVTGAEYWSRVDAPRGSHRGCPVSMEELRGKFVETAGIGIGIGKAEIVLEMLIDWCEGSESLASVFEALRVSLGES